MEQKENKMGTMPVGPLLLNVSVPIIISMLVQALYNIVDSIYVAQYSKNALAAVSLAFPVQNLMIAVAVGTAVGIGSLLARRLGEKNFEAANKTAMNGILLSLFSFLAFAAFGLLFSNTFFAGYANHPNVDPEVGVMGADYMRIVTVGSLGIFVAVTYERLLQSTGRSMYSMISQLAGAIANIVLDPILIFGLLGFPEMGVAGAALATVIGQWLSMGISMVLLATRTKEIKLSFRSFRPSGRTILQIYKVGLPSIVMQSIGSVMVLGMNQILVGLHSAAVSVFGVYFKLQSFIFMPVFGLNNGLVPIVAYNYGARRRSRIEKAVRLGVFICFGIMVAGTLAFMLIPGPLLRLFDADADMLSIGTRALRIISLSFPVAAVMIVFSSVFQALGQGMYSLVISVVRQLVFLLPAAYILAQVGGLDVIWFSFPIAEAAALFLGIFFFKRVHRRMIRPLGDGDDAAPQPAQAENSATV